jgi:flavin-dependent dehydrogenase
VTARIVVIGGGPAGCTVAIGLARAGTRVTLIEARSFPRAKVCGEFISPAASPILEGLISPDDLRQAGARLIDRFVLELGDGERPFMLPRPAWALSRRMLDAMLLERAAAMGAEIVQPASVREVEYSDSGAEVHLSDGRRVEADVVIHADGSGRHDRSGPTKSASGLVGHKCHLRIPGGVAGVRIRACHGAYIGTISVEDGLATCALVARSELTARFRGDADALVGSLWPAFSAEWREGPWMASGVPRSRYIAPGHRRSIRIGNAAAAVDPVGGEGIGLALWSGDLAARLIGSGLIEPHRMRAVHREFAAQYRTRLRVRLPACRLAGAALLRPGLVQAAWPLLALPRWTIGPWYALTGKAV